MGRRRRWWPGLVLGAAVLLGATSVWSGPGGSGRALATETPPATPTAPAGQPNIITIMTDDQTVESMRVMPAVHDLLAKHGVTFSNSIVSWSLCCPSRVTYLTGQYAQNHGVRGTEPPEGGYSAFTHQEAAFPVALQNAGYDTIHIGKYVNNYGTDKPVVVPPGWTEWHGAIDPSTYLYRGYTLLENGKEKTYGTRDSDYQTDEYTRIAESTIRQHGGGDKPFFLNIAYLAPHAQVGASAEHDSQDVHKAVAAPRHADRFDGEPLPHSAAYNEADVSDKPEFVKESPRINRAMKAKIRAGYEVYLESLLAVDDGVRKIVRTLKHTHQLENTVIVFTSDNGFFFGEHRIPTGKVLFYEPSIRVPLIIRGPGVEAGMTRPNLVANIDLAPTILDLAHATPLRTMDGVSLVPVLSGAQPEQDRGVLLESGSAWSPTEGVRTPRYAFFSHNTGEKELYDLETDPDELTNRYGDPAMAVVQADLEARLLHLIGCKGADACRAGPP